MNYSSKILTHFATAANHSQVILVSGAPPVERQNDTIQVLFNAILTAGDIRETLATFLTHVQRTVGSDVLQEGTFSFGIQKLGRFRVQYLTQRGSHAVIIEKMSDAIYPLEELLTNPEIIADLDRIASSSKHRIIIMISPLEEWGNRFAYGWMQRITGQLNKLIFILEPRLSFLLRHSNSLVLQSEVGTDVASLVNGITNAIQAIPDIVFIRDVNRKMEFEMIQILAEEGSLVLLSGAALSSRSFLNDLSVKMGPEFSIFKHHITDIFYLTPQVNNKLHLECAKIKTFDTTLAP